VTRPVYLHGAVVSTTWRDTSRSLTDLIFGCVRDTLDQAGLTAADLDAIVLAAHDIVDGRGLTSMVTSPAAAAYLKDETRLGDDGALAFILGDARVRSGSVGTCLVAAWGRASEGPVDEIAHALFDPFTGRPFALTEVAVSGLRATACLGRYPDYEQARTGAAARRGPRPAEPSRTPAPAWPLRPDELPVWADGGRRRAEQRAGPGPGGYVGMSTEPPTSATATARAPGPARASAQALGAAGSAPRPSTRWNWTG
jgi:hypothetical protein